LSDHPPLASATSTPENPFVVESPERLTPEQIVSLFIPNFTRIGTVRQRKHTFVWGSRGSGKSMIFRYLEPQCQSIVHGSVENYLKEEAFLGLYCPCKEGQLNKTELGLLSKNALQTITEHMINLIIAERLVSCLLMQFPRNFFPREECERFTREVIDLFDSASIASSLEFVRTKTQLYDEPLKSLQALFANENRKISSFLRSISLLSSVPSYDGATSGYHDFLLPMLRSLRVFNQLGSIPVFILLDDADRLKQDQQSIINSWIANRDQQTV